MSVRIVKWLAGCAEPKKTRTVEFCFCPGLCNYCIAYGLCLAYPSVIPYTRLNMWAFGHRSRALFIFSLSCVGSLNDDMYLIAQERQRSSRTEQSCVRVKDVVSSEPLINTQKTQHKRECGSKRNNAIGKKSVFISESNHVGLQFHA